MLGASHDGLSAALPTARIRWQYQKCATAPHTIGAEARRRCSLTFVSTFSAYTCLFFLAALLESHSRVFVSRHIYGSYSTASPELMIGDAGDDAVGDDGPHMPHFRRRARRRTIQECRAG